MAVSLVIKACRGPCIRKMGYFLKGKNIPPVDSFTIIMDFPIMVMFIAFPSPRFSNVPY